MEVGHERIRAWHTTRTTCVLDEANVLAEAGGWKDVGNLPQARRPMPRRRLHEPVRDTVRRTTRAVRTSHER